jgi:MFS transporter, SHS family, lactate transporter
MAFYSRLLSPYHFCSGHRILSNVRGISRRSNLVWCCHGWDLRECAATALEDIPEEAQGLMSGLYQSGCPFGYILASVFYRSFKDHTKYGWRPLFWFGACPPVLLIIFRLYLPETNAFKKRGEFQNQQPNMKGAASEVIIAVKNYWQIMLYLSFLLTGFVYCVSVARF